MGGYLFVGPSVGDKILIHMQPVCSRLRRKKDYLKLMATFKSSSEGNKRQKAMKSRVEYKIQIVFLFHDKFYVYGMR